MGQTDAPHEREPSMGFEGSVIESFARELRSDVPQITGAWIVPTASERGAELWVAVHGIDEKAEYLRRICRERITQFVNQYRDNIRHERFVFDYHVFADDVDVHLPQIPDEARAV